MTDSSRRAFLGTASAGAAAVGIAAIAPSALAATPSKSEGTTHVPSQASGSLVAHVADVHGDTVSLLVGEREIVVHDKSLVAQLARAAH